MKIFLQIKIALLFLLCFSNNSYSQFTDPERDTKWNLGFNMGGVWQDADVTLDRPGFGYGFTLGKGIYESQGKFWSVDLRFRYLKGKTFGQNLTLTDSADIDDNTLYAITPTNYKATQGLLYLNTETALHDFSLEAVINFHALRERTGVLLSVFGGIGITDYRTKTDLLYTPEGQSFSKMYDFSVIDTNSATKSDFRDLQDGDYESFAPFSEDKTIRLMPSLGIGLGYQFSPQWSIGFEHRVTFTLQDKFDGLEQAGTQFLQWGDHDKYHYSSVFLRWNIFRGRTSTTTTTRNCPPPYLKISDLPEVYEVNEPLLEVRARVTKINSNSDVILVVNDQIEQTIYNRNTDYVVGTVKLTEGRNKIYYLATNQCGESMDSVIVLYNPNYCPKAEITFSQPLADSVSSKNLTIEAQVLRLQEGTLEVTLNNEVVTHNYTEYSKKLSAQLSLKEGANTVTIKAVNKCGDTSVSKIVIYFCISPSVSISIPVSGAVVKDLPANFTATTSHIQHRDQISVQLNGKEIPFELENKTLKITGTMNLVVGENKLNITVTNDCGTDSKTILFDYEEPCYLPIVMISEPLTNTTVRNPTFNFEGSVTNVSQSDIRLTLNGRPVAFRFNNANGDVLATLNLVQGTNSVLLSAVNPCGEDQESVQIMYDCPAPTVSISTPLNGTVSTNSNLSLQGNANQVTLKNQLSIMVNGIAVPFTFNPNGNFALASTLRPGQNTISVRATTPCGQDVKTILVTYDQPCPQPFVTISAPSNGANLTVSAVTLSGTAVNINSQSNMTVQLNGITQSFSWNPSNQMYTAGLNLREGSNTIVVSATTNCGSDSKTINLVYTKPCPKPTASITTPTNGLNSSSLSIPFSGVVTNIQSVSQVQLLVNGARVNCNFNQSSGIVTATINLVAGSNSIELITTNTCGTDRVNRTVSYRCPLPTVNISSPLNGITYTSNQTSFEGFVSGVSIKSQISILLNGSPIPFVYDARMSKFSGTISLREGVNTLTANATNQCGSVNNSVSVTYNKPCPAPTVTLTSPINGTVSSSGTVQISGVVTNINSQSDLSLKLNGTPVNFSYNSSTRTYSTTANLQAGSNTIVASVATNCGTDTKSVSVTYNKPCPAPSVTLTSPINGTVSSSGTVQISGVVTNINSQSDLSLKLNGTPVNFSYNSSTRTYSASANLQAGSNTIVASVATNCGTDTKSVSVTYNKPCPAPSVTLTSPINGSKTNSSNVVIAGTATNVANKSDLEVRVNGSLVPFTFNSGTQKYSSNVTLKAGSNTVTVFASTDCGKDNKTVSVVYSEPCKGPSVSIGSPRNGAKVTSSSVTLKGTALGIKSNSQLRITVNGRAVSASFSPSTYEFMATINLTAGNNSIAVNVSNDCGEDSKSIRLTYEPPCPKPTVRILTPTNNYSVKGNKVTVTGIATNIDNSSDLELKVNGVNQPVSYSPSTKSFTASVTLNSGSLNTISATVATNCGTDSKSIRLNSIVVQKPLILVEYPAMDTTTTSVTQSKIFGSVTGITGASKFSIQVNGTTIKSYTLTSQGALNYTFNGLLTLQNGTNVVTIIATHSSGGIERVSKVIQVNSPNNVTTPKVERDKSPGSKTPERNGPTRQPNRR